MTMQHLKGKAAIEGVAYVYAVARARRAQLPPRLPAEGIVPQAPVRALKKGGLLAIWSPVPAAEFGAPALERLLRDAAWTRERVLAHQKVLAALLPAYNLAPFKFCTLYSGTDRVAAMLARHRQAFDRVLRRVDGAAEWGVKIYVERRALAGSIEASDAALKPSRQRLERASPGAAYFARKREERAAQTEAVRVLALCAQESHRALVKCAREAITSAIQPRAVHGRNAEMVFNGAYLVADELRETFETALRRLERSHAPRGFFYELTGPWPPYNFASLSLQDEAHEPSLAE